MGLDQYAYAVSSSQNKKKKRNADPGEFFCWRNNISLHECLETLYRNKGGEEEFYEQEFELTMKDLDELQAAITCASWDDDRERDLGFVEEARKYITNGFRVIYYSG